MSFNTQGKLNELLLTGVYNITVNMNAWDLFAYSSVSAHLKSHVSMCKPSSPHSPKPAFPVHCYTDLSVYDTLNSLSHFHNLGTRSQQCSVLSIPSHNTSHYSSSFTVSLAKTWNSLPLSIRDCRTLSKFKNKLNVYLLNNHLTFDQ